MIDTQSVRAVVADAGFTVKGFLELHGLPTPMAVWKPFILASAVPTVRVWDAAADAAAQVDREWLRLSACNGTVGADGEVLLSIEGAGGLPWLRVEVGDLSRASVVGLPEHQKGFVALSPNGQASTCISSEEWETWILANPVPPEDART